MTKQIGKLIVSVSRQGVAGVWWAQPWSTWAVGLCWRQWVRPGWVRTPWAAPTSWGVAVGPLTLLRTNTGAPSAGRPIEGRT